MKRIALFLDGTWNIRDNNTNVWRLKSLCKRDDSQTVYYSAGVGTQYGARVLGGMFGYGLDQEIIDAYEWLMENYSDGDELFIFGFSRGAYTARSLSGFISKCGLVQLGSPLGVGELYDRYRKGNVLNTIRELHSTQKLNPQHIFSLEENWMLKYSMPVPIKFIGVWDTVGALGVPFGQIPVISRNDYQFLETDLRINNDFAYHALAIDEHREAFQPTLWMKAASTNPELNKGYPARSIEAVEQRWFVGAHANVGGGYESDMLAQIPLKWIMDKAAMHGLAFRSDILLEDDCTKAPITDSFGDFAGGIYRIAKLGRKYYRVIGEKPQTIGSSIFNNINETIDSSVFDRWRRDPSYRPQNLVNWAKLYDIKIEDLKQSVRANDPSVLT